MTFEKSLRHEYLVSVGTEGGTKNGFREWLHEPERVKRLKEWYCDLMALVVERAASHWQDPFAKTDSRQISFDGIASPGGLRYQRREAGHDSATWFTVLFDYATIQQWVLSQRAKRESMDDDVAAFNTEQTALDAVIARAGGNLAAFCVDYADGSSAPQPRYAPRDSATDDPAAPL